jgi:hypothetical protein
MRRRVGVAFGAISGSRSIGVTCRVGKGAKRRAHQRSAFRGRVGTLRFAYLTTFPYDRNPL